MKRDDDNFVLVDTNGNGIPDAFENRPPLAEILNAPEGTLACDRDTVIVEVEKNLRSPRKGEWYFSAGSGFAKAQMNYDTYTTLIVRRVIAGKLP